MNETDARQPCARCGVKVLAATLARHDGVCAPCARRRDNEVLRVRLGAPVPVFRVLALVGADAGVAMELAVRAETPALACREAEAMLARGVAERDAAIACRVLERLDDAAEPTPFAELAVSARPARPGDVRDVPPPLDLRAVEEILAAAAAASLLAFFGQAPAMAFDGFAFDCHARHGEVLLCLDAAALRAPGSDGPALSLGDWAHQGFNDDQLAWRAAWRGTQVAIDDWFERTPDRAARAAMVEALMQAFCAAFVRVERSGLLATRLAAGACLAVRDHDDFDAAAAARLAAARVGGSSG